MYQIGNIYFITAISVIGGGLFGFDISSMSAMFVRSDALCILQLIGSVSARTSTSVISMKVLLDHPIVLDPKPTLKEALLLPCQEEVLLALYSQAFSLIDLAARQLSKSVQPFGMHT